MPPEGRAARATRAAIAVAALASAGLLGTAGCTSGCPAALLEGTLVREAAELVVAPDWGGPIERVEFDPFASPYRPRTAPEEAALPAPPPGRAATVDAEPPVSPAREPSLPLDFAEAVGEHEKRLIRIALADARFNQRRAAQRLSLTYHQFRGLLRKYKLFEEARGG